MMQRGSKRGPRSWLICLCIGAALCLTLLLGRGGLAAENETAFLHILCDALFVPGAMLTCAGLLSIVSRGGVFDAFSYGMKCFIAMLQKPEKRRLPATYFDYVTQRREKPWTAPYALFCVGGAFLIAAGIVLALYYRTL